MLEQEQKIAARLLQQVEASLGKPEDLPRVIANYRNFMEPVKARMEVTLANFSLKQSMGTLVEEIRQAQGLPPSVPADGLAPGVVATGSDIPPHMQG